MRRGDRAAGDAPARVRGTGATYPDDAAFGASRHEPTPHGRAESERRSDPAVGAAGTANAAAVGMPPRRWSQHVTETSNALDLEPDVFRLKDPRAIARSLKRSADRSQRRKSDPYRSAMSMLTFYMNRAGKNLNAEQRRVLEAAKDELRALFHKKPGRTSHAHA
jgi:hypothetical protein